MFVRHKLLIAIALAGSGKLLAQAVEYSFDPLSVKRDPFLPPADMGNEQVSDIQRFELAEMRLMAIMSGLGSPRALVMLPSGKSHIVQKGDAIGRYRGKVDEISSTELRVREQFIDHKGRKKTSITSLLIAE